MIAGYTDYLAGKTSRRGKRINRDKYPDFDPKDRRARVNIRVQKDDVRYWQRQARTKIRLSRKSLLNQIFSKIGEKRKTFVQNFFPQEGKYLYSKGYRAKEVARYLVGNPLGTKKKAIQRMRREVASLIIGPQEIKLKTNELISIISGIVLKELSCLRARAIVTVLLGDNSYTSDGWKGVVHASDDLRKIVYLQRPDFRNAVSSLKSLREPTTKQSLDWATKMLEQIEKAFGEEIILSTPKTGVAWIHAC